MDLGSQSKRDSTQTHLILCFQLQLTILPTICSASLLLLLPPPLKTETTARCFASSVSDLDVVKDMSGGGKGVSSAQALSNAITNLAVLI
ncbi:hypothetical protein LXL04_014698 [Taraxacum kok-saghyz]